MNNDAIGIGCDWGTTTLRAYLLGRDAEILEKIEIPKGIMSVEDGDFQKVFEDIVGYWMDLFPTCPIVLSGMVGSRWHPQNRRVSNDRQRLRSPDARIAKSSRHSPARHASLLCNTSPLPAPTKSPDSRTTSPGAAA